MNTRLLLPLLLCMGMGAPSFSGASTPNFSYTSPMHEVGNELVRVRALAPDGQPAALSMVRGYLRLMGDKGTDYAIEMTNLTRERIMVILAIDGIDPRNGKRAYIGQRGIVLDPGASRRISNRMRKGQVEDLLFDREEGKVTLGVFREKMDYPHLLPWNPRLQEKVGGQSWFDPQTRKNLWLPPSGAPFRKLTDEPKYVYFEYQMSSTTTADEDAPQGEPGS